MFTGDLGVHIPPRDHPLITQLLLSLWLVAKAGINASTLQSLCALSRVGEVSLHLESQQVGPKVTACLGPDPLVRVFTNAP